MDTKPTYQELEQELKEIKAKNYCNTSPNFEQYLLVEIAANGNVITVNQKTCEVLGYSKHEIIGKNWFDNFIPKEIKNSIIPIAKKRLKGEIEETKNKENYVLTKSGEKRLIRWHNAIVEDKAGNIIGHLSTGEDITEQKNTENKLKKALEIIESSPSVAFLWKNEENWPIAYVSSNVEKLFGYTAQEFLTGTINYKQLIYPEDIETVANEIRTYSKNNSKSFTHKPYRIITKNGTIKWVKDDTTIIRNNNGDILEYEGIILDVTENIIANQTLNKLQIAIEHSLHEIFIFDAKTLKFTFANALAIKNLGYTFEELLKISPVDISPEFTKEKALKKLAPLLNGEVERIHFETIRKRKDNTKYPIEVYLNKFNSEGKDQFLTIINDITHKKTIEKQLKESEHLLKEAQKTAKIGHWELNLTANKLIWSDEVYRIFNLKPQEFTPTYASFLKQIHPKDRNKVNNAYLDSLSNKKPYEISYRLLANNNTIKYVLEKCVTEFDDEGKPIRSFGTVQDITNRKLNELKLNKAREKAKINEENFRNLFNNSPISLWEEDISEVLKLLNNKKNKVANLENYLNEHPEFVKKCASKVKVLNVNSVTLNLLDVATKEELISNLSISFNKTSFKTFKEELLALANNELEFNSETEFIRKDGKVITVIIKVVKFSKNKIIVAMDDITSLKNAVDKATENNRLKTEFISNMSHEIRTPLNGILGFSDFLDDPEVSLEKRTNFVKIIKNSGYQLLKIIDDIIEISKLETKQVKTYEEPFNLNDLLVELFSIFDTKAKENKTPLYLKNTLKNNQSIIVSDKFKLYKILSNLIENALKFTNTGFIEFGYVIQNQEEQPILELYVKDTGKGIDKKHQELIFERFVQTEIDTTKRKKGLGLGLSIAKENTELIGGKISVTSTKGKGTTFFVRIPYKPLVTNNEITEKVSEKLNILIVEDEEVNYFYLTTLLEIALKIDCTFIHAKNGLEAVEIFEKNPKIDIVLMDLKMPIMDGYTATKKIKELNPKIPILVQTAYSSKNEKAKAKAAGCDQFISKPITKDRLLEKLKILIPSL